MGFQEIIISGWCMVLMLNFSYISVSIFKKNIVNNSTS